MRRRLLLACFLGTGCGVPSPKLPRLNQYLPSQGDVESGRQIFQETFSGFGCVGCHDVELDTLFPGGPLSSLAQKDQWWQGTADTLEGGIVRCIERYQRRIPTPKSVADLAAGLRTLAPVLQQSPPQTGASTWRQACAHCHPNKAASDWAQWPDKALRQKVRRSDHPNGRMPAFSVERLSAVRLKGLLRWIRGQ